jgi:hypothetical protein
VETPGSGITRSTGDPARPLTGTGDRPIDDPADDLVRHAVPRHAHTDDIALPLSHGP